MKTLNYLLRLKGQYYSKKPPKPFDPLAGIQKDFYCKGEWKRWNGFALGNKWLTPVVELLRVHHKFFVATHVISQRKARVMYK